MVDVGGQMRPEQEIMDLIMNKAIGDERIRGVSMDGSRANRNAVHDAYSDFDIVYYVTDVREFTKDKSWIRYFGEVLIVQYPMDWYSDPYDYNSHDTFVYLIQLEDGNRIDLTVVDIRNIEEEAKNQEPRIILLNKDNLKELIPVDNEGGFFIKKPEEMEFNHTCNEFRWLCIYISKGLCREELYYAKYTFDVPVMKMFIKMLNWKIAVDHKFQVTTGSHGKYLKRYLSEEEMNRLQAIFPNGEYEDIWNKLFIMYDYFAELEAYTAEKLGYLTAAEETERVRQFIMNRRVSSGLGA
jgi:aminoglycoside 6-adenylyltransferase